MPNNNRKSSLKASFVIKKSGGEQILQLSKFAAIKRNESTSSSCSSSSDEERATDSSTALDSERPPLERRKSSKFWGKTLIKRLRQDHSDDADEDLEVFKDLSVSISTFSPLRPYINAYMIVISRLLVLLLIAFSYKMLWDDFYRIIGELSKDTAVALKGQKYVLKFFSKFILTSVEEDRSLMALYLSFVPQMTSLLYGYCSALFFSIYVAAQGGPDETAKELWSRIEEKKKKTVALKSVTNKGGSNKNSSKSISSARLKGFFINRLQGCSARIDNSLGFAFILPALKFLSNYNFKTIPTVSILIMIPFILLVLIDDAIIAKRKFEIDAIIKVLKINFFTSIIGLAYIFFIRFYVTDYLESKLKTTLSEDFGHAVFFLVIFLFVHMAGCALKYLLRQFKPIGPKITSVPTLETGPTGL